MTKPGKKKKIYAKMDLNKFENFVDGEDFLSKPITNDLRETQYLGTPMEIDTDETKKKK